MPRRSEAQERDGIAQTARRIMDDERKAGQIPHAERAYERVRDLARKSAAERRDGARK